VKIFQNSSGWDNALYLSVCMVVVVIWSSGCNSWPDFKPDPKDLVGVYVGQLTLQAKGSPLAGKLKGPYRIVLRQGGECEVENFVLGVSSAKVDSQSGKGTWALEQGVSRAQWYVRLRFVDPGYGTAGYQALIDGYRGHYELINKPDGPEGDIQILYIKSSDADE